MSTLPTIRPAPAPHTGGEMFLDGVYIGRFYKIPGSGPRWAARTVTQFVLHDLPIHTCHRTRVGAIGALVDALPDILSPAVPEVVPNLLSGTWPISPTSAVH